MVEALLEGGGRELLLLTRPDGASCLSIARPANQEEGCRVPQMECQNAGFSSNGAVTGIATRVYWAWYLATFFAAAMPAAQGLITISGSGCSEPSITTRTLHIY